MRTILRALCMALGVASVLIGLSIITAGPSLVARAFESAYVAMSGWSGPYTSDWPPTMDSELRFYAALFVAYGVLLIASARRYPESVVSVPWLAGAFFCGGLGRTISMLAVGLPHPLFLTLMTIELTLPPVLVALWLFDRHCDRQRL